MNDSEKEYRLIKPKMLKKDLYLIDLDRPKEVNTTIPAIIVDMGEMTLIGIGPITDINLIIDQIRQILPLDCLKYIIVPSAESHLVEAMNAFSLVGAVPTVVAEAKVVSLYDYDAYGWSIILVNQTNYQLVLKSGRILSFIRTPFVFTPGAFMTLDSYGKTLFANYLFETTKKNLEPFNQNEYIHHLLSFYQNYVPSTDFVRPVVNQILNLDFDICLTQSGNLFDRETVRFFCLELKAFEFYNSNIYIANVIDNQRIINYETICSQIFQKLKTIFGYEATIEVCQTPEYTVNLETLEIISSITHGPKLWHKIFEIIYLRKGLSWIVVLEPLVKKLVTTFDLPMPLTYQSTLVETEKKIVELDSEKADLQAKVATLENRLKDTMEKMIKDPLTHNYNEMFLQKHLQEEILHINFDRPLAIDFHLFYIQIDNILTINSKYSVRTGDETLRNLGYLLEQLKNPEDLLIKRNGPGFILFIEDMGLRQASELAQKIQNAAKDSDAFIEPISLSVAIVRLSEFVNLKDGYQICEQMLTIGETRIKAASRSTNVIIDHTSIIKKGMTGKLLIADNEEINLRLLTALFFNENYEVMTANDGIEAQKLAESMAFDAIIVERTIAKLDGMQLKQNLNQTTINGKTPYILLTYNKNPDIVIRANQIGINLVIQKPVIFEEIAGFIDRTLKKGGR
ncbi:MAG: response regulator [Candidatus Izemoplasmatales bacterium]|nr:response regulator [Candidatus Izemoplasmatales bacterium]